MYKTTSKLKLRENGFTLIELMIVVAIVGILSAIAVPLYSAYVARSQIAEAFSLLNGQLSVVTGELMSSGACPNNSAANAGQLAVASSISGKFVQSTSFGGTFIPGATTSTTEALTGCFSTVSYRATDVAPQLVSKTLGFYLMTSVGASRFKCNAFGGSIAAGGTDISNQILPKICD